VGFTSPKRTSGPFRGMWLSFPVPVIRPELAGTGTACAPRQNHTSVEWRFRANLEETFRSVVGRRERDYSRRGDGMNSVSDQVARLRVETEDKYPFNIRASVERVRGAYILKWQTSQSGGWNNDFEYFHRVDLPLENVDRLVRLALRTRRPVVDHLDAIWQMTNYHWDDLAEVNPPSNYFPDSAWPGPPDDKETKQIRLTVIPDRPTPILRFISEPGLYDHPSSEGTYSLIVPDLASISAEFIGYLAAHPEHLATIKWRRFEELLTAIFRNHGYDVELGPGSNDGGIDLRLVHKDSIGSMLTLVQAKRYDEHRRIGIEPIAALSAVVHAQQAHRGLFVTTSDFRPSAQKWAREHAREIELANRDTVVAWIQQIGTRLGRA